MQSDEPGVVKGGGRVEFSFEDMLTEFAAIPVEPASETPASGACLDKFPTVNTKRMSTLPVEPDKLSLSTMGLPDLSALTVSAVPAAKALAAKSYELKRTLTKKVDAFIASELSLPENAGLAAKSTVSTFIKAPATRPVVNHAILSHIFTVEGARGPQSSIRHKVEGEFPGESVNKAWSSKLTIWMLRKAESIAGCSGSPFNTMTFKGEQSLSSLHKLARAAVARSRGARHAYKATIAIDDEHLFINGQSFKLTTNRSNGYEYRAVRIPIATLRKVLDDPIS